MWECHADTKPIVKTLKAIRQRASREQRAFPISAESGELLAVLVKAIGANRILDVGLGFGASAIYLGFYLNANGQIDSLEKDSEHITIAKEFLDQANLLEKVNILHGDALEAIAKMDAEYDLTLLDIDVESYPLCYDHLIRVTKKGGIVIFENIWDQGTAERIVGAEGAVILRKFERRVCEDSRIVSAKVDEAIICLKK